MNFILSYDSELKSEQQFDTISTNLLSENSLNDVTSIVSFLENGEYLKNNNFKVSNLLGKLLLWLNKDFLPLLVRNIKHCKTQDFDDCILNAKLLKQKFSRVYQLIKEQKPQRKRTYFYKCFRCNRLLSVKDLHHEHIERIFANNLILKHQLCDEFETIPVSSPLTKFEVKSTEECNSQKCNCSPNSISNFKFNFSIKYCPEIESSLYKFKPFLKKLQISNQLEQYSIRTRYPNSFTCLICSYDFNIAITEKAIMEHIYCFQHLRRKDAKSIMANFSAYHLFWVKQEQEIQVCQQHFLPMTQTDAFCQVCKKLIPYDILNDHLNESLHENFEPHLESLDIFDNEKSESESEESDLSVKISNDSESPLARGMKKRDFENEDLELPGNTLHDGESPRDIKVKNKDNLEQKKKHDIVLSFSAESVLHQLVSHRFLPHFNSVMKFVRDEIYCQCCNITFPKTHETIVLHIISPMHKELCNIPYVSYKFYCDICNMYIKQTKTWLDHFKLPKHHERYEKLAPNRKKKLTEFDCKSCKCIIYGDELSLKRHAFTMFKKFRSRKKKDILLAAMRCNGSDLNAISSITLNDEDGSDLYILKWILAQI